MSQAGQKFLDFLRDWRRGGQKPPLIATKPRTADFYAAARHHNALPKVLARHLPDDNDPDQLAAQNWSKKLAAWEVEVMSAFDRPLGRLRRDHLNFEASPHSSIDNFLKKRRGREYDPERLVNRPWFAQAVTAGAFALLLAIALAKMNPQLAAKIGDYPTRFVRPPALTLAYLFGREEMLADASIGSVPRQGAFAANRPDHNVLASFIVNNRERLRLEQGTEAAVTVPLERLDGRVAGAAESAPALPPSPELVALSLGDESGGRVRGALDAFLQGLVAVQIKASDRAYNWLKDRGGF